MNSKVLKHELQYKLFIWPIKSLVKRLNHFTFDIYNLHAILAMLSNANIRRHDQVESFRNCFHAVGKLHKIDWNFARKWRFS